ncbi:hypothetical protein [Marimonas lutisalis]|uniref:hypothetical protein n=1 Tax=Marimonas lutisalis TaxID=2545756 RepID=UPI0010F59D5C|nr:hypothetical protein [Marimonas lutisalis]
MTGARRARAFLLMAGLCLAATPAMADIPMTWVIGILKFGAWPVLLLIVLIEAVALALACGLRAGRAVRLSLYANLFTAALGVVLYPPFAGVIYPLFQAALPGSVAQGWSMEWIITRAAGVTLLFTVIDTALELPFLAHVGKLRITLKAAALYFLANFIGMAILVGVVLSGEGVFKPPIPDEEIARFEQHYAPEIAFMQKTLGEFEALTSRPGWKREDENGTSPVDTWIAQVEAEAREYRFRWLTVSRQYMYPIYRDEAAKGVSQWTGEQWYRRGNVEVYASKANRGIWYFVYKITVPGTPHDAQIRAWLDPL